MTNLRPTTRARDEASFRNHVLPTFGSMPLSRVDRTSLREWVARLSDPDDGGLAPATISKAVQVFNKAMRAALEDRLISVNPVERLPLPKIEREEMRFLTPDELRRLADTIDPRYRAFVVLAGYSGLRVGELLALRWGNVDMLRRQVTVIETLTDLAGQLSFGPPKTRAVAPDGDRSELRHRRAFAPRRLAAGCSRRSCSLPPMVTRSDRRCSAAASGIRPSKRLASPPAHPRPAPHRRCAVDRRRRQPKADRSEGGPHECVRRPRPLRPSAPAARWRLSSAPLRARFLRGTAVLRSAALPLS